LRWARRTARQDASDGQAEVILLDSIGELRSAYSLASIVFVGGSIARTGGHNILEPAAVGAPVIVGPHMYNFQSIMETFAEAGAVIQLQTMSDSAVIVALANTISELLDNPARGREIGRLAQSLVSENRGATERTLRSLDSIITTAAKASPDPRSLRANSALTP
jgi:3-deoxy-D-manno-octulosonic-acid transferase